MFIFLIEVFIDIRNGVRSSKEVVLLNGKPEKTPAMEAGCNRHKELEKEVTNFRWKDFGKWYYISKEKEEFLSTLINFVLVVRLLLNPISFC